DNRHLHSFPTRRSSDLLNRCMRPIRQPPIRAPIRATCRKACSPKCPPCSMPCSLPTPLSSHYSKPWTDTNAHAPGTTARHRARRSEEHTSELQSLRHLV